MYIVIGLIVLLAVVAGVVAWYRAKERQGTPPPEVSEEQPGAPADRPKDWDPRERYDG